jgi:hypothetical protein
VAQGWIEFRMPWDNPITNVEEYRHELEQCIQQVREKNKTNP